MHVQYAEYVETNTTGKVEILYDPEDSLYKSRVGFFESEEAAWKMVYQLQREHAPRFRFAFVVRHEL